MCLPRFGSPACFAALLDDERAGRWLLAPALLGTGYVRRGAPGRPIVCVGDAERRVQRLTEQLDESE